MLNLIKTVATAKLAEILGDERGADAFEYLMVIGVVVVAVVAAIAAGFPGAIIAAVIAAVQTALTDAL